MTLKLKSNSFVHNIILFLVFTLQLFGCSKSPEELTEEWKTIGAEVEKVFREENHDKSIELSKKALDIAQNKLNNNDMALVSYVFLLESVFIKNEYNDYYVYSSECIRLSDKITMNEQTNLFFSRCLAHYMKANLIIGERLYEENILNKALFHLDKVSRGRAIFANTNPFLAQQLLSDLLVDFTSVDEKILNINKTLIKSLPKESDYTSKKPVVLFILDASGSMYESDLNGRIKIDTAKETIIHAIKKLNTNEVNTSLVAFNKGCNDIDLLVSPKNTESNNIFDKINQIYPAGRTPLAESIRDAGEILKTTSQYTRLVIVSDGKDTCEGDWVPVQVVKELKELYGINVEVFTIGYNVDYLTQRILKQMAEAGGGEYFNAENNMDLSKAFETIIPPEDRDSDWDGVLNKEDECPETPKGIDVDEKGCPKNYEFKVNFDYDKATLRKDSLREVENFSIFLNNNPDYRVSIEGHTDAAGTVKYNLKLSRERANTIKQKLIDLRIDESRLETIGYGKAKPLEIGNDEGNRRVEARLFK